MPDPSRPLVTPDVGKVTDALIALLNEQTTRPWGDHQAPGDERTPPSDPYGIVTQLPGLGARGSVGMPEDQRTAVWQLTTIARTRAGATALMQRAFSELFARDPDGFIVPLDVDGPTAVIGRAHDASGGVDRAGVWFQAVELVALTLQSVPEP